MNVASLMRWGFLCAALAAPAALAQPCPATPPSRLSGLPALAPGGAPLRIVAFGSSSTEGSGASGPTATYPARLQALLARALPQRRVEVVNRGIGGQDSPEMLARIDSDVIALRPQLVIWQVGANAVLRQLDPDQFRAQVVAGIARMREAGAQVVLMDNQRAPRIAAGGPRAVAFAALLRDIAAETDAPLFSRAALMDAWAAAGHPNGEFLIADGLHHNDRGYACVAAALAESLLPALRPTRVVAEAR